MASVVAVRSNTGSTIAVIVAVLAVGAVGIYLASRAIKDFKFPEFNLSELFPDFKFPEFNFKFPDFFGGPTLQDVESLSEIPLGEGISLEQLKQAFKISFPTGTVSRSVGPRGVITTFGVTGARLAPRAIARRTPTFIIVREGAKGAPIIGGSQALFDRIAANLRRATARLPIQNVSSSITRLAGRNIVPKFGISRTLPGRTKFASIQSTRITQRRAGIARAAFQGSKAGQLASKGRRRFRR